MSKLAPNAALAAQNLERAKKRKKALDGKSGLPSFHIDPAMVTIIEDPTHPLFCRRAMTPLDDAWIDEMSLRGNDQPVKVTVIGSEIVCVWGRRRTLGLKLANERDGGSRTFYVIVDRSPIAELQDQMVRENFHRRASDPIEEAFQIKDYLESRSTEDALQAFNISAPTLKNRKRVWKLCREVCDAVQSGEVNISKALRWANLSHPEQRKKLKGAPKKARKPRSPHPRPKLDQIRKVWESPAVDPAIRIALQWVHGEVPASKLIDLSPDVADILEAK